MHPLGRWGMAAYPWIYTIIPIQNTKLYQFILLRVLRALNTLKY